MTHAQDEDLQSEDLCEVRVCWKACGKRRVLGKAERGGFEYKDTHLLK